MKKKNEKIFYPSIFNDVLAPITQGPSSSNTVGPYRIGRLAMQLLGTKPIYLSIRMSTKGGFKDTFFSMSSDKAFLAGLLYQDLVDSDLEEVYAKTKLAGLEYHFEFADDVPALPSEMGLLEIRSKTETIWLTGITLGGGEILIKDLHGAPAGEVPSDRCSSTAIELDGRHTQEIEVPGLVGTRKIDTVYPLCTKEAPKPPFVTSEGMLKYVKDTGKALWECALDYEYSLIDCSTDEIWKYADQTLSTSYASIDAGYKPGNVFDGIIKAKAPDIKERMDHTQLLPTGLSDRGAIDAMAIMEYSNAHGKIVCMPTGGASGLIPAAVRNAAESIGADHDAQIKALLISGLLGVFYYPTHYHGGLGCQAEVGVAASMAAGAMASLVTDDAEAIERAAVLAMQCLIGQLCDPIEGYTQVPCIIRNMASVPLAATCANAAILGVDTVVSLDEMAQAVLRVGNKIHSVNDFGTCMCACKKGE